MTPFLSSSEKHSWLQSLSVKTSRNKHDAHIVFYIVLTLLSRLLGVDDTWLRQKLRILILINTGPAPKPLS